MKYLFKDQYIIRNYIYIQIRTIIHNQKTFIFHNDKTYSKERLIDLDNFFLELFFRAGCAPLSSRHFSKIVVQISNGNKTFTGMKVKESTANR